MDRTYLFRLRGDAEQLKTSANDSADAIDRLAGKTEGVARSHAIAAQAADRVTRGNAALGTGAKLTANQLTQLNYQLNDFFVQVSSGGSPMTALIQQGSQLVGSFGSVSGALRAVGSVITPTNLAIGAVVGSVVALTYAVTSGYQENVRWQKSLALTGNVAGATQGSVNALTESVATNARVTASAAREIVIALTASGTVGAEALGPMATAIAEIQKLSGETTETIVKDFASMSAGVARYAVEKNKYYNAISAADLKVIQQLEAQGKHEQAQLFYLQQLAKAMRDREPQLTSLGRLWKEVEDRSSHAWEAMRGAGKSETVGVQLDKAKDELSNFLSTLVNARAAAAGGVPAPLVWAGAVPDNSASKAAAKAAADAKKNNEDLLHMSEAYQAALLQSQRTGYAARQAEEEVAREQARLALGRAYDRGEVTYQQYEARLAGIQRAALTAKQALIDQDIDAELRRQPGDETQILAQQTRLNELYAQRVRLGLEQAQLQDKLRAGEPLDEKQPRSINIGPVQLLRAFEVAQQQATDEALRSRQVAAMEAASALVQTNREMSIELIQDDRRRGEAQIALEEERLRKQLDLESLNAEDRKRVEDDLATWRVRREALLTEQLKPEYQRNLDLWRDTTRLMKQIYEEFQNDLQHTSEDIWVNFIKTGKLNMKQLVDLALTEVGRLTFRQTLGPLVQQGGDFVANLLGFKPGGGAGGVAQQAAQTAAVTANTAAFTALSTQVASQAAETFGAASQMAYLAAMADAAAQALATVAASGGGAGGGGIFGNLFGAGGASGPIGSYTDNPFQAIGLAGGGSAERGSFHQVNEIAPELLTVDGKTYLMMGSKGGTVTPFSPPQKIGPSNWNAAPANSSVYVNVSNNGQPVQAQAKATRTDQGLMIDLMLDAVANDVDNNGRVARAHARRFGSNGAAGAPVRGRPF